ncbi:MAG: alpha/beta hydrolase, partial [Solirubrobacterales bacterium]|nr:alpha/beta hydrolase [Solirubrobacterales bacterium]
MSLSSSESSADDPRPIAASRGPGRPPGSSDRLHRLGRLGTASTTGSCPRRRSGPTAGSRAACCGSQLDVTFRLSDLRRVRLDALDESVPARSGPAAWKSRPSWTVVGTEDRVIPPDTQRHMAERAGETVTEVAGSHVSMVSHPQSAIGVAPLRRTLIRPRPRSGWG